MSYQNPHYFVVVLMSHLPFLQCNCTHECRPKHTIVFSIDGADALAKDQAMKKGDAGKKIVTMIQLGK